MLCVILLDAAGSRRPGALLGIHQSLVDSYGSCWSPAATRRAQAVCLMENNEAVLLFDAIKDRAASVNAQPAVALGISMAHELGHLLRQSTQHALAGVMKRRWLAEDLAAAEGGTLTFTREESESMRNRIERLHKSAEIDLPCGQEIHATLG